MDGDGDGVRGADDGGGRDHLAVGRVRVVVVGVQGQAGGAARGEREREEILENVIVVDKCRV